MANSGDPATPQPPRELSFGVGCFRFTYWDDKADSVKSETVLAAVRGALEALPAVNNLEVLPSLSPDEISMDDKLRPLLEAGDAVVSPRAEQLDFELYIPERVQATLIQRALPGLGPDTGTERFLRANFKDPAGKVTFEALGPSPFHADFYVALGPLAGGQSFSLKRARPRGYADLRFVANEDTFGSTEEALDALLFELSHELGLFYDVTSLRVQAIREWDILSEQIDQLLEARQSPSRKERKPRSLSPLDHLMNDLARFELAQVTRQGTIAEHKRRLYDSDVDKYLVEFAEESIKEFPQYPTEQVGRVLAFHWSRRQKRLEYAVAAVSALIGGVAGSLITLAASK
jgi:hypothetical protein